jgi:CHAD domain-containing protein
MAFRLKLAEPFGDGCKRIAREQIDRAQAQLKDAEDPPIAVHETRKSLKRLRALLRLVRPSIGDEVFRAENAHLRGIARMLSGARDRHVLLETVSKLEAGASGTRHTLARNVRELLNSANGGESPTVDVAAMRQAHSRLAEAKGRFARLRLAGGDFDLVGAGLERSYRQARRAYNAAYEELSDEAFHEWRKSTQQHWRHMALLSRAWPACLGARSSEARRLSQILGDDHDLAMLVAFVRSDAAERLGQERIAKIETLARQRQKELRALARPAGARLFAEGAGALRRRIAVYWEAAVALREPDDDEAHTDKKPGRRVAAKRRLPDAEP